MLNDIVNSYTKINSKVVLVYCQCWLLSILQKYCLPLNARYQFLQRKARMGTNINCKDLNIAAVAIMVSDKLPSTRTV